MSAPAVRHRQLATNGITMHVAEQGEGDAVAVMCHGFPGLWFSWRHQLPAVAAAGWRAIAVDMRGYGRTDRPARPADYTDDVVAADMTGLLDALGVQEAVFVGHDFGAPVVWDLARRFADRVRGVAALSVPFVGMRRSPARPSEIFAAVAADHFFHLHYFQEPGRAEAELNAQPRRFLRALFWALSGEGRYLDTVWSHPSEGNGYLDVLPDPPPLPWPWMTKAEVDHYAAEFGRTGFAGGLNWYRAADVTWELAGARPDTVEVPALFIAGERDAALQMMGGQRALERMSRRVPALRDAVLVPEAGHFVQMERPDAVNDALVGFLAGLAPQAAPPGASEVRHA